MAQAHSVMHIIIRACSLCFFYNPYMSLFNSYTCLCWEAWKTATLLSVVPALKRAWNGTIGLMYSFLISIITELLVVIQRRNLSLQESCKYFVDGWVSDILILPILSCPSAYLVSGRVKHSQRPSLPVK